MANLIQKGIFWFGHFNHFIKASKLNLNLPLLSLRSLHLSLNCLYLPNYILFHSSLILLYSIFSFLFHSLWLSFLFRLCSLSLSLTLSPTLHLSRFSLIPYSPLPFSLILRPPLFLLLHLSVFYSVNHPSLMPFLSSSQPAFPFLSLSFYSSSSLTVFLYSFLSIIFSNLSHILLPLPFSPSHPIFSFLFLSLPLFNSYSFFLRLMPCSPSFLLFCLSLFLSQIHSTLSFLSFSQNHPMFSFLSLTLSFSLYQFLELLLSLRRCFSVFLSLSL